MKLVRVQPGVYESEDGNVSITRIEGWEISIEPCLTVPQGDSWMAPTFADAKAAVADLLGPSVHVQSREDSGS